jgi:hypothetical protein
MHTSIFALRHSNAIMHSINWLQVHSLNWMRRNNPIEMGRYRAIMTETDREHISGESNPSQDQKDQAVYRVRQRIDEELPQDIALLKEHRPDVLEELQEVVCEE